MLQGTEDAGAPRLRFDGFLLVDYQNCGGGDLPAGPFAGQSMLAGVVSPKLSSSAQSNMRKLLLGVRGALNDEIAYSVKTVSGNNAVTRIDDGNRIRVVESSLTFNYIPGARLRVGLFKAPGSEESLSFLPPRYYINFSAMTNMLMRERFFAADGSDLHDDNAPIFTGCCRDIGLMLFDSFMLRKWEISYAAMLANGHGLRVRDENDNPDAYLYFSTEYLFGAGKKIHRQGWKLFGWYQEGQRTLEVGLSHDKKTFQRCRYGVGTALLWRNFRLASEMTKADGMIFSGTDAGSVPGSVSNISNNGQLVSSYNVRPEDQALGWYIDCGYQLLAKLWLSARYDRLNLNTETTHKRKFETVTLGALYQLNRHIRLKINYEFRHGCAPRQQSTSVENLILAALPDRFSAQLIYMF